MRVLGGTLRTLRRSDPEEAAAGRRGFTPKRRQHAGQHSLHVYVARPGVTLAIIGGLVDQASF